jgi:2,4-dienoyl-CoA reductase-like NADH-dependent reductase (Old Yellow Enzyme family)
MGIESLFQSYRLRSLNLTNRVVLMAMSRYHSTAGVPNEDLIAFHSRRAAAGVSLQLTGATAIDRPGANNHPNLANFRPDTYEAWRNVVGATHAAGGFLGLQIWHAGALFNVDESWQPDPIESPSGLEAPGRPKGVAMTESMIADTIAAFAEAARKAVEVGFDAIEIHGAHGFLIDEFFWSGTNLRKDRWGGATIRERARFGVEVTRAVRAAIPDTMPLLLKISQWKEPDYFARIATSPAEMEEWLNPFAEAGIDLFDCSQRRFWETEFEGSDLNFAGWVKKVTGVPSISLGSVGLNSEVMEFFTDNIPGEPAPLDELLRRFERGDFDLVGVGRALLGDPEWLRKVQEGRMSELKTLYVKEITQPERLDPQAPMISA